MKPTRSWIPTILMGVFLGMLAIDYGVKQFQDASGGYVPHHYGFATFVGFAYLFGTWLYARELGTRARTVGLIAEGVVAIVCVCGFIVFHLDHEAPLVFVRDHLQYATPYHMQVAVPMFVTAIGGVLILVSTMQLARSQLTQAIAAP